MLSLVREKLIYATESDGLAHDLATGRPIGGKAWNSFIRAICAKSDEEYVKLLLDVASEVTKELDPTLWEERRLLHLLNVSRDRTTWPMMVGRGPAAFEEIKAHTALLKLGASDGRQRKAPKPRPSSVVAEEILERLHREINDFRLPSRYPLPKWPYFYVCANPPEFTKSSEAIWRELAGVVLDIYYGSRSVRKKARDNHLAHARQNRPTTPFAKGSLTARQHGEKQRRETDLEQLITAWRDWDENQVKILEGKTTRRWPDEPPPFIQNYSQFQKYGRRVEKGKERPIDFVKGAEAFYKQIKKDVLDAVANRLPKEAK